jgi:stearoyl-CoA desaturase (Delta-9 desaturase)
VPTELLDRVPTRPASADEPLPPGDPVEEPFRPPLYRIVLTAIVAVGPVVAAGWMLVRGIIDPMVPWRELVLLAVFYVIFAHAITIGFHRLFTHRSFEARRPLKITLGVLGSMAFQGSLIGWVADHRRHHRYAERPGDPHSPVWSGQKRLGKWRGFWHAHIGWTFNSEPTPRAVYAPDLIADPDLVLIDRLFLPCCLLTLALPFGIGYALTGTLAGAVAGLMWAGILRIGLGHNITWSVNSVCHIFGKRPFATKDDSTNVAALSFLTMGESFHNSHHAFPTLARHGIGRFQFDSSAILIRFFERIGWATNARWPQPALLDARRN